MYSLKKSTNLFAKKSHAVAMNELCEIHIFEMYKLVHNNNLTNKERSLVPKSMTNITEKMTDEHGNGNTKELMVMDGSKQ